MLQHIYRVTYFFNRETQSSHQKTRERMEEIEKRIEKIAEQEQDVRRDMEKKVEDQTRILHVRLHEYIHSMDFKTKLCAWSDRTCPSSGKTWEVTKSYVNKAIDYRFKQLLIQWENDHQVYAEIHRQLLDEFRTRFGSLCVLQVLEVHAYRESFPVQKNFAQQNVSFVNQMKIIIKS